MRRRLSGIRWLALLIVAWLLGTIGYDQYAMRTGTQDGLADAHADINAGALRLKWGGHAKPWRPNVIRLFKTRFDVDVQYLYDCSHTLYEARYAGSYNRAMYDHVVAVRGSFPIEQLEKEARDGSLK